jgi:transcriptional regulator with XRE-family HTH domain
MNNLRSLRDTRQMTLKQVADIAGTSVQQVQRLEKGERELTPKWIAVFKKVYNVSVKEISEDAYKMYGEMLEDSDHPVLKKIKQMSKERLDALQALLEAQDKK